MEEIDEDTKNNEFDKIKLERQIKLYIKKHNENNEKIDENKMTKEIISFINFKMNESIE